jgi:hypothetical protein
MLVAVLALFGALFLHGFDQPQEVYGCGRSLVARSRLTLRIRSAILDVDGDGVPREPPQRLMTPASVLLPRGGSVFATRRQAGFFVRCRRDERKERECRLQ